MSGAVVAIIDTPVVDATCCVEMDLKAKGPD